ncbi:hypothetical protein, partial [Porphyromonas gingivalis]|uniref:hypothetical protein n=1 Tax=Porphyromonas gingivalis TaxID=837 RepID=UPI001E5A12C5
SSSEYGLPQKATKDLMRLPWQNALITDKKFLFPYLCDHRKTNKTGFVYGNCSQWYQADRQSAFGQLFWCYSEFSGYAASI